MYLYGHLFCITAGVMGSNRKFRYSSCVPTSCTEPGYMPLTSVGQFHGKGPLLVIDNNREITEINRQSATPSFL